LKFPAICLCGAWEPGHEGVAVGAGEDAGSNLSVGGEGAGVEETETGVTKVLEEAVNTIDGIEELRSTTREGVSVIVVSFVLEKSREVAAQDVRDKVASVLAQLPTGTDSPVRGLRPSRAPRFLTEKAPKPRNSTR